MITLGGAFLFGQKSGANSETEAKLAFLNKNFDKALNYYRDSKVNNPEIIYKRGLCYYYLNRFDSSLIDFQRYLKVKNHKDEAIFYTASALHQLENYQKAAELYRLYLKVSKPSSALRSDAKRLLMHASNFNKIVRSTEVAVLMPLSKSFNSNADDFVPVSNPRNPGQLFFSSNRRGLFELFFEKNSDAENNNAVLLDARYNLSLNQQLVAFPDSGYQVLYIADGKLKSDNFKDGFDQSLAVPLKGLETIKITDAHLVNDSILLFSANIPGGFGGMDLFATQRNEHGRWSNIKNLGPRVNTVFDERAAFLMDNTSVLYFSSNRPQSMGGFDVFKIDMQKNIDAIPFSFPVNSPGDELFFKPEHINQDVWISSIRPYGFGGFDNYRLRFREPIIMTNGVNTYEYLFGERSVQISEKTESRAETDTFYFNDVNFYTNGNLEPVSEKILNEMANFLQNNANLKLVITAHTDNELAMELSLLFTLSQCEKTAAYLIKKGITADRIYIRGLAGQYPAAKNKKFDNSSDQTGMMINRRIEFNFVGTDNIKTKIIKKEKMISSVLKENGAEKYLQNISGLSFKIDLSEIENQKSFDFLGKMSDVSVEKKLVGTKVSFCLGLYKKFDAIAIFLETINEAGFSNARIVPYYDGFPLDENLVKRLSSSEPELQKYLNYLKTSTDR